jgi:hypothetical protein
MPRIMVFITCWCVLLQGKWDFQIIR